MDLGDVAGEHGQRHRLAERPAEAEDDRPDMLRDAVGRVTARIVSHVVAPRPKAASRILGGTAASESREIAEMVGRTMMASTMAAGSIPGPLSRLSNIGIQPRFPFSQSQLADRRDQDENAPEAVYHAGNGGQQLHHVF